MLPHSFDAIVVGAGIVGAACAREFAGAGMNVAVCEKTGTVGNGATAAGMGHLAIMDDSEAQFALTSYSQSLWRDLATELPKEAEYWNCGSLWVGADEEELAEAERKHRFYSAHAIRTEILDSKQLQEAEPHLRARMAGALLMPNDSVCYPPVVADYLIRAVIASGGKLFLGAPILAVSDSGVEMRDGRLDAGIVVLATGAAITKLVPGIEVHPRKGHLLITDRYPGSLNHQIIELGYLKSAHSTIFDSVAFNAQPRVTGQILIGSSRQYGIEDPQIDHRMLSRMLQRAIAYMPILKDLSAIRTWTGFRAATPDKLPLIGRCPGYEHVYLATGHEGLGISTSLATARLLADEIFGRTSSIAREPYQPSRSFALHA